MSRSRYQRRWSPLLVALALLAAACGGRSSSTPTPAAAATLVPTASATAASTPTATATAPAPAARTADVDRVQKHLQSLAVTIGSRPSSTQKERDAANYIAGALREAGYDVTLETFPVSSTFDDSSIVAPGGTVRALAFAGTPQREVSGPLVAAGIGRPDEFAGLPAGAIALLDRGELTFADKLRNATNAGAAGVIVANSQPGPLHAALGPFTPTIPSLTIALEDRPALAAAIGQRVTLRPSSGTRAAESQNVVARSGAQCRVVIGAHYDSVDAGPGANDNGSGTASMIELARAHRTDGLCAVAFGSEEIGLVGSKAFAQAHPLTETRAVLNFDMMGKLTGAVIVGDAALTGRILATLAAHGEFPIRSGSFPPNASSDHVSFANRQIPAVTFYSGDDQFIHTASDNIDNVDRRSLQTMLAVADAAIEGVLENAARTVQ